MLTFKTGFKVQGFENDIILVSELRKDNFVKSERIMCSVYRCVVFLYKVTSPTTGLTLYLFYMFEIKSQSNNTAC